MDVLKYLIYFLIFLFPLFWLPFSFENIEFNKLYFLFFLSWFGVFFWFLEQIVVKKEISFRYNLLDFFIFLFFILILLSFVFSQDKISSFLGSYLRFNDGILAFLSFFGIYFLVRNNLKIKEEGRVEIFKILKILLISSFFVILWTYISLFGLWQKIPSIGKYFVFSPVSFSIYSQSIFLSLIFVLTLGYLFSENKIKKIEKVFLIFILILSFILISIFDFTLAWYILIISLIFLSSILAFEKTFKENIHIFLIPISLILLSLFLSFINVQGTILKFFPQTQNFFTSLPKEYLLPQRESFKIGLKSASSSFKNAIFGSGPGTFFENFSLYKSKDFWNLRLQNPGNNLAEILTNFGFLATLIFSFLLLFFLILIFLRRIESNILWLKPFFLSLILVQFFYYQNFVLGFLLWIGLGLAANLFSFKIKRFNLKEFPVFALLFETLTVFIGFCLIIFLIYGIIFYIADYNYKKGFFEQDLEKKVGLFERAKNLNFYQPYYKMALSQVFLQKYSIELQKQNPDQNLILQFANSALNFAKEAEKFSPRNILYKENLALVYRDLGLGELSKKTFEEALKLEPKNATFYFEIGRLQISLGNFDEARKNFEKAIEIEPNFIQANLQKALTFEFENNLDQAISEIENILQKNSLFAEGLFHLGRIYYLKDNLEKAKENLNKALALFPNYSNARYILALVYEKEGKLDLALNELKEIEKLNPGNSILEEKIKEIQKKLETK
jgi:Tfp pilus assembly protein PilF